MDHYYVYMSTPKGWKPIKEFRGNESFAFFDSSERLSFQEASQRRDELEYLHPDYMFQVIRSDYNQSGI